MNNSHLARKRGWVLAIMALCFSSNDVFQINVLSVTSCDLTSSECCWLGLLSSLFPNNLLMLRFSTPSVTVCAPKALKDSDQVAQGDGEESPAAEEQLLGEVLTFLIFNMGKICGLFISQ